MRAIRIHEFGGPEVMWVEQVSDLQPGDGQIVVQVQAIGVNQVDTYIRGGSYHLKPLLPFTPGMDAAGVVKAIGKGVRKVRVGDRVYVAGTLSGAYAEQALCSEAQVFSLPESVSFAQGAGINVPYSAAYRALFHRARCVPGETVLVHGATGGVGIAAVQLARATGMQVIGTGGSERGRHLVLEQGGHHVLNHRERDYLGAVFKLTDNQGVDVVLETLANVNLDKDLKILARGGRVVVVGNRGTIEINPRDAMLRDASVLGMLLMNTPLADTLSIHAALAAGLESGTLSPVVGQEFPLEQAVRAHHVLAESNAYGKAVLIP